VDSKSEEFEDDRFVPLFTVKREELSNCRTEEKYF
jgi:hypothetical protein